MTLVPGLKILRDELSKKLNLENDCDYAPEEIVVSSGAKCYNKCFISCIKSWR